MKALITGVGGFIGGHLAEFLMKRNWEIIGTVRHGEEIGCFLEGTIIEEMDILNQERIVSLLNNIKPDCIYHLVAQSGAGSSWNDPYKTIETNLLGTTNLLEAVRASGLSPRIVIVGSSEEYGLVKPEDTPISEEYELKPANPYALSKTAQEMLSVIYVQAYKLDIIMTRNFNTIGIRQRPEFVIPFIAKRIAEIEAGKAEPTISVGNIEVVRDFIDVKDVVNAFYLLAKHGQVGEVYNVGAGQGYSISDLIDILLSYSKVEIKIEIDQSKLRPIDVPSIICNNSKLKNATGWKPNNSIEKTLLDILDSWRQTLE